MGHGLLNQSFPHLKISKKSILPSVWTIKGFGWVFKSVCMWTGHFTVVCFVTWPWMQGRLKLTLFCLSHVNANSLAKDQLDLYNKSSEVCIKTRSSPGSLPFRGQVTKLTTVKWSIHPQCWSSSLEPINSLLFWVLRPSVSIRTWIYGVFMVLFLLFAHVYVENIFTKFRREHQSTEVCH